MTGDLNADAAWSFATEAAKALVGQTVDVETRESAVASVREIMSGVREVAEKHSEEANAQRPFHGTTLGLEVALLDLIARCLNCTISELLGEQRRSVQVSVRTLSNQNSEDEIRSKVLEQAHRFPMIRVKGSGDIDGDLNILRVVHETNVRAAAEKPIWMDLNEGLDSSGAGVFVERVARDIGEGRLPREVTLEQPVPHSSRERLPALQRQADKLCEGYGSGTILIMADESLWDTTDLEWLHRHGGCRAINIKTAKAGGLLASLDLARRAVELDPDMRICVGGMVGTSDITTWSLVNLAKAMPRLDYITAAPPGGPVARISEPLVEFEAGSSVHTNSPHPGLGATLAYDAIIPFTRRHFWFPTLPDVSSGPIPINKYESAHLREFGKIQLDSHLLERECLALGLGTFRTSQVGFVANDGPDRSIGFWWTKSTASSRTATAITSDKHSTRLLLQRAGIPVPNGDRFGPNEIEPAIEYAKHIGFPVVLKPLRGTGGRGVVTDIHDAAEMRYAFDSLKGTGYENRDVIVEEQIEGTSGRVFVVGDDALSMIQWPHGAVIGDGQRTVGELLLLKHEMRMRNPHLMNRPIKLDAGTRHQLERQGVTYDTVLTDGREVIFSSNPNPQQGGETRDAIDVLHPSFVEASVRAVKAIPGLSFSGVDWIIPDLSKPLSEQRAAICELNAHPSQSGNEFPLYGRPSKVSRAIVRLVAGRRGLTITDDAAQELTLRMTTRGRRAGEEYREWFASRARAFGVSGWIQAEGREASRALVAGPSAPVAALASLAFAGPRGSGIESVETVHAAVPVPEEFEVRS
ncbi:enolase C-terminal domain-like protein [Ruania rhizosphaerae]|uniref:enolase C-terminal domain-like protein n=1 Tax=Ruania rhizosphaerae TaxID=1840413 RepID=UPI001F194555|nr:enolase C-terminal domain-like protein [Ruania rhizosphaerae]